jgi:hypothetical protein
MALSILDGNQSATTLSTIVTSGQHITAHTVVSLGTQAVADITTAISGSTVCVGNLGLLQSTVATEGLTASGAFIKIGGHAGTSTTGNIAHVSAIGALRVDGSSFTQPVSIASVTIGNTVTIAGTVTANPTGTQTIAGTVTANVFGKNVNSSTLQQIPIIGYDEDITAASDQIVVPVQISNNDGTIGSANPLPISGTVSLGIQQSDDADANIKFIPIGYATVDGGGQLDQWTAVDPLSPLPVYFPSNNPLPAGTNRIGVVTIGAGTVTIGAGTAQIGVVTIGNIRRSTDGATTQLTTEVGSGYLEVRSYIGAGTAQIGSVTASISGTVPISISSVTVGNSVTIGSLPAISGTVTANAVLPDELIELFDENSATKCVSIHIKDDSNNIIGINATPLTISGTVTAASFAVQGTAVTTSNFTSTTASTVLAGYNATREVLTIFNEGAGNLHICAGATCTTIAYQVRLSAGDYYEVPNHQTSLTHSAVFATAGTARICQVS